MKVFLPVLLFLVPFLQGCRSRQIQSLAPAHYSYNQKGTGQNLTIVFKKGAAFNHPLMAIWIEDTAGNYLQTLFVSESIGQGIFQHGDASSGKWMPGEVRRPAALPYWSHKRGIQEKDGLFIPMPDDPMADAYTGPTPQGDFTLNVRPDIPVPAPFAVLFEINQSWDWNEYWTNNKYPGDEEYKTSCQPAIVYKALITKDLPGADYPLNVIGHSHYAGKDGKLYTDLSTITTALDIIGSVSVRMNDRP